MKTPSAPSRALLRALAAAAAFLVLATPAQATDPEVDNFDARPMGEVKVPAAVERAGDRLRERLGRFGALSLDDRTGTLRSVGRLDGYLTGPSGRESADIALGYARDNASAFGLDANDVEDLRLVDRDLVQGVEHLAWEQRYRGIPAVDAGLEAAITGSGRLLSVTGPPAADLAVRSVEPSVSAADAYVAARTSGGDPGRGMGVEHRESNAEQLTRFSDGGRGSLVLYRAGRRYRLAWRVLAPVSSTGVYDVLVDARSAATVRRINHVKFAVPADVFTNNPATSGPVTVDLAPWLTSSSKLKGPNAHAFLDIHDAVGPQANDTYQLTPGPGSDIAPGNGGYQFALHTVPSYGPNINSDGCPGTSTTFPSSACTWDPRPAGADSWAVNQNQSATQLFYLVNRFHDHLRDTPAISFIDGGFRDTGKPLGDPNEPDLDPTLSDPVLAQALDGAKSGDGTEPAPEPEVPDGIPDREHRNNASFLTLPDGQPGLMQIDLFMPRDFAEQPDGSFQPITTGYGAYDGANDASIVFHEYTHGLSDRLVKDAGGYGALNTIQAGALAEGLSDFYAMDFLNAEGLQPDDPDVRDVRVGEYVDNRRAAGFRRQPIDCEPALAPVSGCIDVGTTDPELARDGGLTYADFGEIEDGPEVHSDGEIWVQTLWSLRSALIAARGDTTGISRARQYVTQGMRLSPAEPSFLEMRDRILLSAAINHGGEDLPLLWPVFADRGMGWSATTMNSDDPVPSPAFDIPPAATTGDPSSVQETAATLSGLIDPNGAATSYAFQFGETTSYGVLTPAASAGSGADPVAVTHALTGLRPGTTYHYRVVALRGAKELPGADRMFTTVGTPQAPPAPLPPPTPLPPAPPVAKATSLSGANLTADRRGFFKVKVRFGDAAALGSARLTVSRKAKRLARALTPVRPGRTVVKTLRLNKRGRKVIKPGQSKTVKLKLRLPSGEKFEKTLKLTRKRR